MELLFFEVLGDPAPAGSKTVGFTKTGAHFVRDSSGNAGKRWRRDVQQAARIAMRDKPPFPRENALEVIVQFKLKRGKTVKRKYPTVKPDATKLMRAVEDALKGIVYEDDSQIVRQTVYKMYVDEPSYVLVTVFKYDPPSLLEEITEQMQEAIT